MKTFYYIIISVLTIIFLVFSYSFIYRVFIAPPVETTIKTNKNPHSNYKKIQIEVRNGTNINGLASKMTGYLRKMNFDVITVGNWKHDTISTSLIYDRLGNRTASLYVAKAIGLEDSLVYSQIDSSLLLNTTIIIGYDYKKLKPYK